MIKFVVTEWEFALQQVRIPGEWLETIDKRLSLSRIFLVGDVDVSRMRRPLFVPSRPFKSSHTLEDIRV